MVARHQPSVEELEAYMHLTQAEITRLVLCLLIEEALGERLAAFRSPPQDLAPQPLQGSKELLFGRGDVVPVGDRAG